MLVMVIINEQGGDFSIETTLGTSTLAPLTLDDIIVDQNGNSWAPNSPVTLKFQRLNTIFSYPLQKLGTFQNEYESTFKIKYSPFISNSKLSM
jgi:hypothetical protein